MRLNPLREIVEQLIRRFSGQNAPVVTQRDSRTVTPAPAAGCPLNAPTGACYFVIGVDYFDDETRVF